MGGMGYRCPVCEVEQADAVHVANHLAVTASLGRRDHLAWLEEYAPEWEAGGPAELAPIVREHAVETETPAFEPTGGSVESAIAQQSALAGRGAIGGGGDDEHVQRILEEAMALTREREADENENA